MTTLELVSTAPAKTRADVLVLAAVPDDDGARLLAADALPAGARDALARTLEKLRATGAPEEVLRLPAPDGLAADVVLVTGAGAMATSDSEPVRAEALRRAAGSAARALAGSLSAALALPAATPADAGAVAEGALLGAYAFTRHHGSAGTADAPVAGLKLVSSAAKQKDVRAAVTRAQVVATAVLGTRDLVNTAPNELFPASFADRARELSRGTKVKVTVLDEDALRAGGYGGLVGVGQGSVRGPRLVKVEYKPSRPSAHYALVGKGITFDSGGLSIKPAKSMETMKCDMAGAAAVLHTVLAAAELGLGVRVTGWLALAENMPSGTAQRPSDVITIRGGTTVEVLNTDAEGRLVLADGLVAAGEESPDALVDVATLTGAQMVALGNAVSAVMGTDDLRGAVVDAAESAGEQFWPMPLPEELRPSLKSSVADIANIGDRFGGMLVAGLFLREFTDGLPWAHLDIAGPAFRESAPAHYQSKGGTGVAVRTLLRMLEDVGRG